MPLYALSVLVAVWVIVQEWMPSMSASSTAVTVTVRGTFQLTVVNVNGVGAMLQFESPLTAMATSAVGALFSTTVKLPVAPPSVTATAVGVTVTPGSGVKTKFSTSVPTVAVGVPLQREV